MMEQSASSSAEISASPQDSFACQTMTVHIHPTTGGHFEFKVTGSDNVDYLKKLAAEKLNVPRDRICLLYRERQLSEGTLLQNNIMDGSKLILLPSVETGLLRKKKTVPHKPVLNLSWLQVDTPEQSVMQALESLGVEEVNGFLTGAKPLRLQVRLGDHMMYIQLQLSTTQNLAHRTRVHNSFPLTHPTPSPSVFVPGLVPAAAPSATTTTSGPSSPLVLAPTPLEPRIAPVFEGVGSNATPRLFEGADRDPTRLFDGSSSTATSDRLTDGCRSEAGPSSTSTSTVDSTTLVEASRHLTQTLQQISSAALESRIHTQNAQEQGAVIESMRHHGCGVYSGTFSGTLNPALQDRFGRPKRDISTIIHILNDLLGTAPPAHRRRRLEPSTSIKLMQGDLQSSAKSQEDSSRMSQENMATRGKMEQLQVMFEERRARRQARREARSPYPRSTTPSWTSETNNEQSGSKCQINSNSIVA